MQEGCLPHALDIYRRLVWWFGFHTPLELELHDNNECGVDTKRYRISCIAFDVDRRTTATWTGPRVYKYKGMVQELLCFPSAPLLLSPNNPAPHKARCKSLVLPLRTASTSKEPPLGQETTLQSPDLWLYA